MYTFSPSGNPNPGLSPIKTMIWAVIVQSSELGSLRQSLRNLTPIHMLKFYGEVYIYLPQTRAKTGVKSEWWFQATRWAAHSSGLVILAEALSGVVWWVNSVLLSSRRTLNPQPLKKKLRSRLLESPQWREANLNLIIDATRLRLIQVWHI